MSSLTDFTRTEFLSTKDINKDLDKALDKKSFKATYPKTFWIVWCGIGVMIVLLFLIIIFLLKGT